MSTYAGRLAEARRRAALPVPRPAPKPEAAPAPAALARLPGRCAGCAADVELDLDRLRWCDRGTGRAHRCKG